MNWKNVIPLAVAIGVVLFIVFVHNPEKEEVKQGLTSEEATYQKRIQEDSIRIYQAGYVAGVEAGERKESSANAENKNRKENISTRHEKIRNSTPVSVDSLDRFFSTWNSPIK